MVNSALPPNDRCRLTSWRVPTYPGAKRTGFLMLRYLKNVCRYVSGPAVTETGLPPGTTRRAAPTKLTLSSLREIE